MILTQVFITHLSPCLVVMQRHDAGRRVTLLRRVNKIPGEVHPESDIIRASSPLPLRAFLLLLSVGIHPVVASALNDLTAAAHPGHGEGDSGRGDRLKVGHLWVFCWWKEVERVEN